MKEKAINTKLIAISKLPKPQLAIEYIPPTEPAQRRTDNFDLSTGHATNMWKMPDTDRRSPISNSGRSLVAPGAAE